MQEKIVEYVAELDRQYQTGTATEHTYRPALQRLLASMMSELTVTNEPRRIECGAPDYIITDNEMPIGYVEAKDIGTDLNTKAHKEQFNRYLESLDNLIITDYLTFKWYLYGELHQEVTIGQRKGKKFVAEPANFGAFQDLIRSFAASRYQGIGSAEQLAKVLALRARLLANNIAGALKTDEQTGHVSMIGKHLQSFRKVLLRGMMIGEFADIYAQTIAYGMFAAWLNDTTGETFTRSKAERLIPHSNPFLRKFFRYIADDELDVRINWGVDTLANSFNYADRATVQGEFNQKDHDPVIHFFETFLTEYDPALRKSRGVWYTPLPAVRFIIQAVDDILKQDYGLAQGLADSSDRVQILDPALGTGNFLAETIRHVYQSFQNQQGMWQHYVSHHLLPRLNGFEILMAPYAMAHLKLGMLLRQTGYKAPISERLRIYLTNSLEEAHDKTEFLMTDWLSDEANEASRIKRNVPIMVVMGNPPYSGESQNSDEWMDDLMLDYKKEPSGEKLQERNSKWINDDYVKFIRLGQDFIKRNPEGMGVLAFINNHNFLDNPTFRGMRWELLQAFDKIYVFNLHGNSKKKENAPDGGKDENVFDIQQGVSINIFVKAGRKKEGALATVFHSDLYGRRANKFAFLRTKRLKDVKWKKLKPVPPYYFFVAKDFSLQKEYNKGFGVRELFMVNGIGITTAHDEFVIGNKVDLVRRFEEFKSTRPIPELLHEKFNVRKKKGWDIYAGWRNLQKSSSVSEYVESLSYRPFDNRHIFYEDKLVWRCVRAIMQHFLKGDNVGLVTCRQSATNLWTLAFVTKNVVDDSFVSNRTKERGYVFPLYLYPDAEALLENEKRKPNLNDTIVAEFSSRTGLRFIEEKEKTPGTFAPIDLLDYIYAVLHSPIYRERYKEFLKIDFPRVPYPESADKFWALVQLGGKLRRLHLMEGIEPSSNLANFPIAGTNEAETLQYTDGKVRINETQYFDCVPAEVWSFYIGGYQPAQKWLKDRKGQTLNFDDIRHYQKIVSVLKETIEIMNKMDEVMQG